MWVSRHLTPNTEYLLLASHCVVTKHVPCLKELDNLFRKENECTLKNNYKITYQQVKNNTPQSGSILNERKK
jgi:hypothetical protein